MNLFKSVPKARPPRAPFDLSYPKLMTASMGYLYPVLCEEVLPSDVWSIGLDCTIRCNPLVSPVIHPIDVRVEYFFCSYDMLDDDFEDFITGGEDGDDATTLPQADAYTTTEGTLADYFGVPLGINLANVEMLAYPWHGYWAIWNNFYRNQNVDDEVANTTSTLEKRRWEKDYFTAALPWQQRGTAVALPLSGTTNAEWDAADFTQGVPAYNAGFSAGGGGTDYTMHINNADAISAATGMLNANVVDFADATTYDLADIRLASATQRILERLARTGARFTEYLKATFGVAPSDERMERPEFLGGAKFPLVVSEVLQTSESGTTDQGNLAGHGIAYSQQTVCKFRAKEHGLIMGLLSICPKPVYQQGIHRQWLRQTRFDFYDPLFAGLSEQAILTQEIYASDNPTTNTTVFGYQGAWDEYRVRYGMVCGALRSDAAASLDHWHLARDFGSAPNLNTAFVAMSPDTRIFAAPSVPGFIVNFGNVLRAVRPLTPYAVPGGIM